jgi:predicted permease
MNTLLHDLRLALRQFGLRPGLWGTIVVTLALGIGANAAVFHVFERLMLASLPFPEGERLVVVHNTYPKNNLEMAGTSVPDYFDRVEQAKSLDSLVMFNSLGMNLTGDVAAERVRALRTTPSLFDVLRTPPTLGRAFNAEDAIPGGAKVVILTHALWLSRFNGAADAVGRDLSIDGETWRVIGVMPPDFRVPTQDSDLLIPFQISPEQRADTERGNEYSFSIGRLAPGATIVGLNSELDAIVKRNMQRMPAEYKAFYEQSGFTGVAQDLHEFMVGDIGQTLWTLQLATVLVLLIACANVANLLLAQNIARTREFAVRSALGAVRAQLIRLTMVETAVAALIGAAFGLMVAHGVLLVLREFAGSALLLANVDPVMPWRTQLLTLVVGVLLVPLVSLLPTIIATRDGKVSALKDGGRGNTGSTAAVRARSGLVIAQIALSSALLVTSGLLVRSYWKVANESPGFDARGVTSAFVELPKNRYPDEASLVAYFDRALARVQGVPGVEQAGWVTGLPFTPFGWGRSYRIRGVTAEDAMPPHTQVRMADGGYFKTVGIPLLKGRVFGPQDRADSEQVVVIDEFLARERFGDRDPIGQFIGNPGENGSPGDWWRIIGVVGTVKTQRLDQAVTKETIYWPISQAPVETATLVVKSARDAESMARELRAALQSVDPMQAVFNVATLDARIDDSLGIRRAPLVLVAAFAVIALLLAAIGLYGVLAFVVGRRSGEIGLRIAIGARTADVMRMVVLQGVRLVGIGLALGLGLAAMGGSVLSSQLFGVGVLDPLTFAIVAVVLLAAALAACIGPARRAAAVDPIDALRSE